AAMVTFEEQTACIVEALFCDLTEDDTDCRSLETDSGVVPQSGLPNTFDPVLVASCLRRIAERCNVDFERVSSQPLAEVLQGKKLRLPSRCLQTEKFGAAVESISRSWSKQNPELSYEIAFLSVSVKLLMYVVNETSFMIRPNQVTDAINGNAQVRNYIEARGGWVRM
ncbi:B2L15 protein, partial [Urocolius indicus]|nr:B2L15 protein [Urocolius indicus]